MKKIIRLTESELVSLVKNVKMELEDTTTLLDKIMTYQGDNQFLKDLSSLMLQGGTPNSRQLEKARFEFQKTQIPTTQVVDSKAFSREIAGTPQKKFQDANNPLRNTIISKGENLYRNLKNSKKKFIFEIGNYEFATPNQDWIDENIDSMKQLRKVRNQKRLVELNVVDEASKDDKKEKVTDTLDNWIEFFLGKLDNNPEYFVSYVTKKDKKWTQLPKLDTNFKNWVRLLDKLNVENKLGNGTFEEKVNNFFEQKKLEEVVSNERDINLINAISQKENMGLTHLSLAEYELFKEQKKDYVETIEVIKGTSDKGDESERKFFEYLEKNGIYDLISFSSPGNQVDMIFGVDLLMKSIGNDGSIYWIPVQVKSSEGQAKYAMLLSNGLGGISVYESKDGWRFFRKKGGFSESFDEKILKK